MPLSYNPRASAGESRRGSPRLKRSRTQMNSPTIIPPLRLPTGFKNMESQLQIDLGKSLFELAVYKAEIRSSRRIGSANSNLMRGPCHCDPPFNCLGPYRPELPYRSTSRSSTYNQDGVLLPKLSDGEKFETYLVDGRLDPVAINMKRVLQSSDPAEEVQSEAMAIDGDLSVLRNLEDVLGSELFNNADGVSDEGCDINHGTIEDQERIPVVEEVPPADISGGGDSAAAPATREAETAATEENSMQDVVGQNASAGATQENSTQATVAVTVPVAAEDVAKAIVGDEPKVQSDQEGRESPQSDKMKKKVTFEETEKAKKKPNSPKRSAKKKEKTEKVEKEKGGEKKDPAKEKAKEKTKEKSSSSGKEKKEKGGKVKKVSSPKGKKSKKKSKEPEPAPEPEPEVLPEPEEKVEEVKEEIPPEPVIIEPQPPKYTLVSEYKSKYQMVREWLYASSEHMAARTVPIL